MPLLTLQTPHALMLYSTRGGAVTSDANGIVTGIPAGSQLLADLMAQGAYVIPTVAPADGLQDPVE